MIYSRKGKFIFIHVYKNAGTSIRHALQSYNDTYRKRRLLLKTINVFGISNFLAPASHITAFEARKFVGYDIWKDSYTFAVVRNPWDWQVSLYFYMLKLDSHPQHQLISSMASFDEYIAWRCKYDYHSQLEYLSDSSTGEILVGDIYRFEQINIDIKRLESHLGHKIDLPVLNKSNSRSYRDFYSTRSMNMVADFFANDIAKFNYKF